MEIQPVKAGQKERKHGCTSTPFNFLRLLFPISPFFFKFTVNYPFSYSNFDTRTRRFHPCQKIFFFFAGIAVFLPLQGRCTLKTLLNSILTLPSMQGPQHRTTRF